MKEKDKLRPEQKAAFEHIMNNLYKHCDEHGHSFPDGIRPIMVCEYCCTVFEIPELFK